MSDHQAPFNILGSFADPVSFDTGAAKLTNVRVVTRQQTEGRAAKVRLVGTPGLALVNRPVASAVIALCRMDHVVWSIHANGDVYSNVDTVPVLQGTVNFGAVPYPIARFGEMVHQLAITTNYDASGGGGKGSGYVATLAGGVVNQNFQLGSSINFDPSAVAVLDNIAIWAAGSNTYTPSGGDIRMYASAVGDATSVSASAFASKEGRADNLIDVALTVRNFFAFGQSSLEMWYDSGSGADFSFAPFTNTLIDVVLANRRTLATVHGKLAWVGTDCRVWLGYAQSASPVSPGWLDLELQRLSNAGNLQELTAFMYAQGGDEFYVLTRPGFWTLEVALSSGVWNYVQSNGRVDSARRCAIEFTDGVTYVGLDSGHVCKLDITTASEPAGNMAREIITPWVGDLVSYHVIDAITVTSSLGSDAGSFMLDWSEDSFASAKGLRAIQFAVPGTRRAIARQLGSSRRRQIRLRYNGTATPFEFDEFFGDVTAGT